MVFDVLIFWGKITFWCHIINYLFIKIILHFICFKPKKLYRVYNKYIIPKFTDKIIRDMITTENNQRPYFNCVGYYVKYYKTDYIFK